MGSLFEVLAYISNLFRKNNIHFEIGGSVMLFLLGMNKSPRDIDFILKEEDFERAMKLFNDVGVPLEFPHSGIYHTKHFASFSVSGIEIDLMVDFQVKNRGHEVMISYHNPTLLVFENQTYPISNITLWYIAYLLMPRREQTQKLIESYILNQPGFDYQPFKPYQSLISNPDLLSHIK